MNYEESTAVGHNVTALHFDLSIVITIVAFFSYPFVFTVAAIYLLIEISFARILVTLQLKR